MQAYNDLSDEKSKDYETVKQTVLKSVCIHSRSI